MKLYNDSLAILAIRIWTEVTNNMHQNNLINKGTKNHFDNIHQCTEKLSNLDVPYQAHQAQ